MRGRSAIGHLYSTELQIVAKRTSSLSSSIQARFKLSLRLANLGFCALSKMMHARLRILSGVEVFRTQQRENIEKTFSRGTSFNNDQEYNFLQERLYPVS
jgi:hypothetical protein